MVFFGARNSPGGSPELTGGSRAIPEGHGRVSEGAPGGSKGAQGASWRVLGRSRAAFGTPRGAPDDRVSILEVSGGLRKRQKIVREHFFEFRGGQILIFRRFRACPLCEFEAALGRSWAVLGGSPAAPEAPKLVLGGLGGVPEKRVPPTEGSRELPGTPKRPFDAVVVFTEVHETLRI